MLGGRSAHVGAVLLALTCVAACGPAGRTQGPASSLSPSATPAPTSPPLAVDNWTDGQVTLVVNGQPLEVISPGTEWPVKALLPPLPWDVEVQARSGRALARLAVSSSNVDNSTRVDLACGRIDIFTTTPVLGPAAIPGSLPPCD